MMDSTSAVAPEGTIWICTACGKQTTDRVYGKDGWDESCMLKSVLCHAEKIDGMWQAVRDIDGRLQHP